MDCLDEPLQLEILSALAGNLATSTAPDASVDEGPIAVIIDGLPEATDTECWSEFEINHAISYAHYVTSLSQTAPYLGSALPRLHSLLWGLVGQASRRDDPSPSARDSATTMQHANLLEALVKAVLWVGWACPAQAGDAGAILAELLEQAEKLMTGALTFAGVILTVFHSVVSHVPLPEFSAAVTTRILAAVLSLGSPSHLAKSLRDAAGTRTPLLRSDWNTAPHPTTPHAVALLVTEVANILLARALTPAPELQQAAFVDETLSTHLHDDEVSPVWTAQTNSLLREPALDLGLRQSPDEPAPDTTAVLNTASKLALLWWNELNDLAPSGSALSLSPDRRNTVLSVTDNYTDDELYLAVAVLHMLNLLSIIDNDADGAQLARLKHLLAENSVVGDARILQAAFVCLAIIVRNNPHLGTGLTHHLRRLLMNPIPALENEGPSSGMKISPTVCAASTCLAMCIEMSSNDDAISSTLYSLLGVLSHGGTTIGPGIMSVRSMPLNQHSSGNEYAKSLLGGISGKRTEEQKQQVSIIAVEIVSRLALDTGRDDIIHLAISMLLQRLRGVDIVTESAIVTNLVPLTLSGSNADLVEVYRTFSQLSRSSHPEDPRTSSNAVLAAQTTLAKGLGTRLDGADGYLTELLTLFVDKGTQIQIVAMSADVRDRDQKKLANLRVDAEKRVQDMKAGLAALLIPISELLSHENYNPQIDASSECVALFRNLWLLCVVFGLSGRPGRSQLSDHEAGALAIIAKKTPPLVPENANDFIGSELEYNTALRKDFASSIHNRMRRTLSELLPSQKFSSDIRNMTTPQLTLVVAIHDLEETRTLGSHPSVMLQYFSNHSINKSPSVVGCLTGVSDKLAIIFLKELSREAVDHTMPDGVADEVCKILVACTHRMRKVREVALNYARQIIETFSSLMCHRKVVFTLLEILTLMRRSCEMQYTDEYYPIHHFSSDKMNLTLELTDDYTVRNEITQQLYSVVQRWLTLAISRAPIEVQSTLQSYLNESRDVLLVDSVEMGAGVALHYSKVISRLDRQETIMPVIGGWQSDCSNLVASQFAAKNYYDGELAGARHVIREGLSSLQKTSPAESSFEQRLAFQQQMSAAIAKVNTKDQLTVPEMRRLLLRGVSALIASPQIDADILHQVVDLPIKTFTPLAIAAGVDAWTWLVRQRPEAEKALVGEISAGWLGTIKAGKGLFSTSMNYYDPFVRPIEYAPSDKVVMDVEMSRAKRLLMPHLLLVQILSSQFQAVKYSSSGIMVSLARLMLRSLNAYKRMSTHPLAREVRFSLLLFGFQILASSRMETLLELRFRDALYRAAFAWFAVRPQWSFGSNRIQVGAEIRLLQDFVYAVTEDRIRGDHSTSSMTDRAAAWLVPGSTSLQDYVSQHRERVRLMQLLVENEINRLLVWSNPTNARDRSLTPPGGMEGTIGADEWTPLVRTAWKMQPAVAVHMGERFKYQTVTNEIVRLVRANPKAVIHVPEALSYFIGNKYDPAISGGLKWLLLWDAVPPIEALDYFQPRFGNNPIILQYAMRVLEQHPVELVFFFVPQVVQALRSDALGYVERFIFETSKISQLFCHQIIWNMKANTYKDDNGEEPDSMKPQLDRMVDMIVASLSGKASQFYEREFGFFADVTSISGKLKPYIKKTKPEKKAKIDEEMAKIKLEIGVYLPSNPDGVVIDLDRKSGRPLQSHAKAPFMATFKVRKERMALNATDDDVVVKTTYDVWQSAIFKVGDDCRQDVLALQLIAMFKNVFTQLGLTMYLFPYRVTATAPGCGVIDVVPNATSRDEMGRAQINDLVEYFIDKYGGVDTVSFQKARLNFIQSMAAYSVACYILQIKDRHNGNIMIDGEGHIVHIDFGFLFDIGPGGIKFEAGSFKLNREMVALMGGADSQGYKMFTDLTIKAFLAIRPHANQLVDTVGLMLGTGLPSFKGEGTIRRLRDRFQLQLGERQAADYMMGVIKNAHENMRSDIYDGFQKYQNGIPY